MSISFIIAQILGFAGLGSNIASVQSKRRRFVLLFQVLANVFYGVQYIFLAAWPGLAVSLISALECVIVYCYANRSQAKSNAKSEDHRGRSSIDNQSAMPKWALALLMIAVTVAGFVSYTDGYILIPIIVTLIYFWSVWQPNLRVFRLIAAAIPVCWFIYNLHVGAYVPTATAVVEFISALAAIIRIDLIPHLKHRSLN